MGPPEANRDETGTDRGMKRERERESLYSDNSDRWRLASTSLNRKAHSARGTYRSSRDTSHLRRGGPSSRRRGRDWTSDAIGPIIIRDGLSGGSVLTVTCRLLVISARKSSDPVRAISRRRESDSVLPEACADYQREEQGSERDARALIARRDKARRIEPFSLFFS